MHPVDSSDFDVPALEPQKRRKPGRPKKVQQPTAKPAQPTSGYQRDLENLRRVQESRPMKPPGKGSEKR